MIDAGVTGKSNCLSKITRIGVTRNLDAKRKAIYSVRSNLETNGGILIVAIYDSGRCIKTRCYRQIWPRVIFYYDMCFKYGQFPGSKVHGVFTSNFNFS